MGDRVPGLLRLRVTPPAVPAGYLHRPRLADMLTAGAAGPVTLVSAGPGSGKTLTMAAWARGPVIPGAVAWLAVDDSDNDLQTFWSDVLGALTVGAAVPADSALRQMMPAAGFGAREVAAVRAGLAELPGAVVLVLDDFHHVTDRAVLDSFDQLLDHQPPQLHLMLAARADPALRLHRLRVNGQVTDVRARDLAFTAPEAAELFSGTGLRLSDRHLAVLLDRSRGWAAGLRLALMCLDPADIDGGLARFTGSNHLVAEYLIEQVIDQLTDPDREFLLTTSVADRLTAGLVNAVTGRDDGQSTLERLTAHNALLVDLTGRSEWFGVHPLLRDLLSHRLSRDRPGAVTELHLRAARWFTGRNDPIPAIRHAGLAGQWDEVGRVLTTLGLPLLLTSRSPSLVAALAPAAARARLQPTASTLLAAAVCDYHRHDFDSMARDAGAAADLTDGVPAGDRAAAAALTLLLQMVHARTRDLAAVTPIAARLLHLLDRTPLPQLPTAEHYRVIATNNIALGQLWTGDLAAAATNLSAVQTRCTDLGLGFLELSAQAHLALLDAIRGELPDAAHRAGRWRRIAESRGWAGEPHALALYAALALTDIDRNRLDTAAAAIDAGLAVSNGGSDIACRLVLAIAAVQLALARRDPAAARAAAARLDGLQAQAGALPPMLHLWCAVAHADTHLASGHPQAAIDVLTGDNPEPVGFAAALRRVDDGQGPTAAAPTRRRARPARRGPGGVAALPRPGRRGPGTGRRRGGPDPPRHRRPGRDHRRDRPRPRRRHDQAVPGRPTTDRAADHPAPARHRPPPRVHR